MCVHVEGFHGACDDDEDDRDHVDYSEGAGNDHSDEGGSITKPDGSGSVGHCL